MDEIKGLSTVAELAKEVVNVVEEEVAEVSEESLKEGEIINCLKVKADAQDISPEDRKRNVKKLAGAISHSLRSRGEINVRCFGSASIGKAAKALAIARGYTANRGPDLYCWPAFIVSDMNGSERTGICFYVYSNEM
jgi:stage V sporulation protein SpoVS